MRKITATILSLVSLAAMGIASLLPSTAPSLNTAKADGGIFHAPTDIATAAGYTAVAEGNALYLFNHTTGGFWQEYTHSQEIAQIAFDTKGTLYFRDAHRNLFTLNATDFTEEQTALDTRVDCGSFFLCDDALYYVNSADSNTLLYAYGGEEPTAAPLLFDGFYTEFTFYDDTLYGLKEDGLFALHLHSAQATMLTRFASKRNHLAVSGNQMYTLDSNGLYAYDFNGGGDRLVSAGSYTAISSRKERVYALQGGEVYVTDGTATTQATEEFKKPHIATIPTGSLQTDITQGAGNFSLVTTKQNTLLVEVDLENATQTLPLIKTTRSAPITALKIGETEDYSLLAYRAGEGAAYQSFIVAKDGYTPLEGETLYETEIQGYLTNGVRIYKYPHLGLPALTQATRNAQVTLLGEVSGLDCAYYKVRYGETVGYIPKVYAIPFEGSHPTPEQTAVGKEESGKDSVWRMAYILLGAAAIGILVDFLLLRKKNED